MAITCFIFSLKLKTFDLCKKTLYDNYKLGKKLECPKA